MKKELENIYLKYDEPDKSCLLALREIILSFDENLTESVKYGMPFFSFKGKMFCYFWFDKKTKEPYIGFMKGKFMKHNSLVAGDRKLVKTLPINSSEDIDIKLLREVLREAIECFL